MDVYQRRRLVALSALAGIFIIFVLLIRSCGGDDEEEPVAPLAGATGAGGATVLAQSDYIAQADAICLEANTSLANVDETDAAQAASDQADIATGQLQQLQTLPPPDDGEDKLDKFLAALEEQATAYEDKATAAERADEVAIAELDTTIDETAAELERLGAKFGFEVCGDPSKVGESETTGAGGSEAETETPSSDTGAVEPSTTPITPEAPPVTEPVPPVSEGGGEVAPAPEAPPADTGGTEDSSSGGVSP